MAITFVNDLRLSEMATGDNSGTWGNVTNTNLELIGEALGYGTEGITTNADTHTSTIADGSTDPVRALYVEYTGTLDSACTITIAPNTVSKVCFIENGTSGSQNIIIKQGSGATVTIPPGDTKAVYLDGAGSGAAVVDAFASLSVVDLKVQDDLTVTGLATIGETLAVTGIATFTDDIIIGDGKTIGSASTVGAITIASDGDITLSADLNVGANFDVTGNAVIDGTALVTGVLTTTAKAVSNGGIGMPDDAKLTLGGTGTGDLQIYHDGSNSFVNEVGDGALFIKGSQVNIQGDNDDTCATFIKNGASTLHFDNAAKIATKATGVTVTGEMAATTMDLSSNAVIDGTALVTGVLTTTAATVFNGGFAANDSCTITKAGDPDVIIRNSAGGSGDPVSLTLRRRAADDAYTDWTFNNSSGKLSIIGDDATNANNPAMTINFNGDVVFNEDHLDADFRVESDTISHALFVEGETGFVGIGCTAESFVDTELVVNSPINTACEIKLRTGGGVNCSIFTANPTADHALGFKTAGTERARFTSAGDFLVGATAQPSATTARILSTKTGNRANIVAVQTDAGGFNFESRAFSNGGVFYHFLFEEGTTVRGSISSNGSSTTYATSSDYRLKENVVYDWDATTRLKQLKPAQFNFIGNSDTTVDGFLAHEAQAVVPESVVGTKDEVDADGNAVMQGIDQAKLVPLLVKTILELEARITALEG